MTTVYGRITLSPGSKARHDTDTGPGLACVLCLKPLELYDGQKCSDCIYEDAKRRFNLLWEPRDGT